MSKGIRWLLAVLLTIAALGCGTNEGQRGKNSAKDRPKSAPR